MVIKIFDLEGVEHSIDADIVVSMSITWIRSRWDRILGRKGHAEVFCLLDRVLPLAKTNAIAYRVSRKEATRVQGAWEYLKSNPTKPYGRQDGVDTFENSGLCVYDPPIGSGD